MSNPTPPTPEVAPMTDERLEWSAAHASYIDMLLTERNEARRERDEARSTIGGLAVANVALRTELAAALAERDTLQADNERLAERISHDYGTDDAENPIHYDDCIKCAILRRATP